MFEEERGLVKKKFSKFKLFLIIMIYSFFINVLCYYTNEVFGYYTFFEFSFSRSIISSFLILPFVVTFFSLTFVVEGIETIFYGFCFLIYYLPGLIISYVLMNHFFTTLIFLLSFFFHGFLIIIFRNTKIRTRPIKLLKVKISKKLYLYLALSIIIFFFLFTFYLFGIPDEIMSLGSGELLYEARTDYYLKVGPIARYLFRWITEIFVLVLFSFTYLNRKKIRGSYLILFSLISYVFLISQYRGQKAYIVLSMVMLFSLLYKFRIKYLFPVILYMLIFLLFISTIVCFIFFNSNVEIFYTTFFVTRRAIIIPSAITVYWIDWFSNTNKQLWSYLFSDVSVAEMIGSNYMRGSHSNSGFIADGFSNAGILGVIFNILIIHLILSFLNKNFIVDIRKPFGSIIFIIYPFVNFISTRLTVSLFSGGVFLLIIFSMTEWKLGDYN